ncbi:CR2 protein, partial [Drymodes brunneopygia]|nr:CR2 protein [Drymodes brunneopygia]
LWSLTADPCVLSLAVLTCKQPRVENGKLLGWFRSEYAFGDTVVFDCDLRYSLSDNGASTCKGNDLWEPPLPLCQRSSCDDPPDVRNAVKARLAGNLFPVDTVVTYECQQGHQFSTGATSWNISCLSGFVWSEPPPPCERLSCPDPHIPHGNPLYLPQVKKFYEYGDRLEVACSEGFAFQGRDSSITLRCGSDGGWHPAVPECIPVPRCPKLNITNGKIISGSRSDYTVGAQVKLDCVEGYTLRGSATITCGADLSWKPELPFCDEVCGPPPTIPFGWHSGRSSTQFPYGAKVTYECAAGLSLVGNSSIYCTSGDGRSLEWSGPAPECRGECLVLAGIGVWGQAEPCSRSCKPGVHEPVQLLCELQCSRLPVQEDVVVNFKKMWYEVNETVSFYCKRERLPATLPKSTCSPNGTWTPPPMCKKRDVCERAAQYKAAFQCGIPLADLKTLLEVQKLYLEIQKLEKEL